MALADRARFAGHAASVEGTGEGFPGVGECRGWFVLGAGRPSVGPGFGRTLVAQLVALSVLAQVPELERFATHAASLELILLQLVAGVADVGVCGEVSLRALMRAPCAPRGRGGRRNLGTHGAYPQGAEADAHFVQVIDVVAVDTVGLGGEAEVAPSAPVGGAKFVSLRVACVELRHHRLVF